MNTDEIALSENPILSISHAERQKAWYEREKIRLRKIYDDIRNDPIKYEAYLEKQRERFKKYREVKITCGCGSTIAKPCFKTHEKSQKHRDWIESERNEQFSSADISDNRMRLR